MASLKEMRNRISSVKATQKITKAMQMVAAAKLRRAQESAENARPYAERMAAVIANLAPASPAPARRSCWPAPARTRSTWWWSRPPTAAWPAASTPHRPRRARAHRRAAGGGQGGQRRHRRQQGAATSCAASTATASSAAFEAGADLARRGPADRRQDPRARSRPARPTW